MSNRYSSFPSAIDELKRLSEVQEMSITQKRKVSRYTSLATKESFTPTEEVELQTLIKELKDFQLNSSDWNKVIDAIIKMQEHYLNTIIPDIGAIVDEAEETIQNKVDKVILDVSTSAEAAKSYINKVLVDTEVELNNKISQIVSNGTAGIDYFKGRTTLTLDTAYVKVNVPQYNRSTDFLMVYVNGGLIVEGVNFIIRPDNFTIEAIGGNWSKNTIFDFVVLKRTIITLQYYDAGLFEDGTIRKEKLTAALQSEITNATNNKQDKTDISLKTTDKTVVGAINENTTQLTQKMNKVIQDDTAVKKYELGINNGLLYYREVVE